MANRPERDPSEITVGAIVRNENGAMLVMGIFMVMFIAATLYYIVGVGDTIMYRERMQDAADATSMTGAVFLARGMNLITLMNLTLASVFGVLVSAQAALLILLSAAGIASSNCSIYNPVACIAAICLLISTCEGCDKVDEAKDIVSDAAAVTTRMQRNLSRNTPIAAMAAAVELGLRHYDPPAVLPLAIYGDGLDNLPVEEDPDPPICSRTTAYNSFAFLPYLGISYNATELADDIGGSCPGNYLDQAKASSLVWSLLACQIQQGEVDDKLYRVTPGVQLGGEEFQFRTLITGTPPSAQSGEHEDRVAVATWDADEGESVWGLLGELSRFSFAQSEFLFDGDNDRDDWLWELKWRARMRRFRCNGSAALSAVCLDAIEDAVAH